MLITYFTILLKRETFFIKTELIHQINKNAPIHFISSKTIYMTNIGIYIDTRNL